MQRRRVIRVLAAAAGLAALPGLPLPSAAWRHRWRGSALGAEAGIDLWLDDAGRARRLVRRCLAEIDRLEGIFSLHRRDSALSALNRNGRLRSPPPELVSVLELSARIAALSGGAFDVTVQPLWRLYADAPAGGPSADDLARLARLVDWRAVDVAPHEVRLARPGMAVTLNGVAQGFIADRLAGLLGDAGLTGALLDVGEIALLGTGPGGAWKLQAGTAGPTLELEGGAAATSGPSRATGAFRETPHLLDPATLRPSPIVDEVTVVADSAMIADALSTALAVRPFTLPVDHRLGVRAIVREPAGLG